MNNSRIDRPMYARLIIFLIVIALSVTFMSGCRRSGTNDQAVLIGESTVSLLLHPPLTGNENEVSDPPPETSRLTINEESVEGWAAPEEGVLRFPVKLGENAGLSVRLGVLGAFSGTPSTLIFKVNYKQKTNGQGGRMMFPSTNTLFETSLPGFSNLLNKWEDIDVTLDEWSGTSGEIQFIVDGDLSKLVDFDIIWGAPSIYYPDSRRNKNVLLIGLDTMRADALSLYGGREEISPNLERFSESATIFNRAWSQAPWTLPSFASIITGQYPSEINATGFSEHMPDRTVTIGERLLPEGYATFTACTITWLGFERSGFHQGMEGLWFRQNGEAAAVVERGKEFITRSIDRDWFCFLHFIDPHCPLDPPEEMADLYHDPDYEGPYSDSFSDCFDWPTLFSERPPDSDISQLRRLYDGEVAGIDAALGELFSFLEENGLMEDTLIIISSDHGEEFFDHDSFEHGHTQYEELVRVPLIVSGDGFPSNFRVDSTVGNIDIVPTILKYVDLPVAGNLVGFPLQDIAATDGLMEGRVIFGEETGGTIMLEFAVEWPYKCVLDFLTGNASLYDLSTDPTEQNDISDMFPDLTEYFTGLIIDGTPSSQTVVAITVVGNINDEPHRFSGEVRVPGGIEIVKEYTFMEGDYFELDGDTVSFDITSSGEVRGATKLLAIVPSTGADIIEIDIQVDGESMTDRFFPYGTPIAATSGTVTISIDEFPWPASLPEDLSSKPSACYVVCMPGTGWEEYDEIELDLQTIEQLRAVGYFN